MKKDWNTVEVLRHARHDWLNKLQLIKGNLALNKIDRVKEIIDEIVMEAQQETKLSNLKIPAFASLLLTCNWENYAFQIDFDIMGESGFQELDDQAVAGWTSSFFDCLNSSVEAFAENHLSVTLEPKLNGTRFFFDFSGIITDIERINQFLDNSANSMITLQIKEFSEHELGLEFFIPL